MPADPAAVKSVFLEAVELPAADRSVFLAGRCGADADLLARVSALLAAHDAAGEGAGTVSFADGGVTAPPAGETADRPGKDEHVGAVLAGKYKLVEAIGEGGMGSVFLAQQTEPVKRAVAVKVIKAGMDSKAVLARFEAERQALAVMDHPHIAKVLDAGTTEGGRPFFVMELVKGIPITQFCDERKLTPRQRLELFVPVCQALQHAHQKGVIHRDIKPSNVLVALYDDRPVPKVIDFGVAKAAGQTLTDKTLMTGFGAVVGTPEYMSPEQASLNNLDVDTRSDVYSLGVLLYELLTGSTPVDRKSLGKAALMEVLRIVREVEAPKPSAKLSTIDTLPSVAANRGTEPAKLSKLMRGELDWLVLKALEKDRTRRYETANGFAADVLRYLSGEPVQAHPPSRAYRVRKFVRRNKGQVLAGVAVAAAVVAGVTVAVAVQLHANRVLADKNEELLAEQAKVEARNQELAAEQAKVQARFALARKAIKTFHTGVSEDVLLKSDQHRGLRTRLLREAADFYAQMEKLLEGQTDRRSRTELGHGYFELAVLTEKIGTAAEAMAAHRKALSVRRELAAAGDPDSGVYLSRSLQAIAYLLMATGDSAGVKNHLDELLALLTRIDAEYPDNGDVKAHLAGAYHTVGNFLSQTGHPKEALESFRKAAEIHEILVDFNLERRAWFQYELAGNYGNMANCLQELGMLKESLNILLRARRLYESLAKIDPAYRSNWAACLNNLASLQSMTGDWTASLNTLREARDVCAALVKDNPTVTHVQIELSLIQRNIGLLLSRSRRYDEALAAYRECLTTCENLTAAHPSVTRYQTELAHTHMQIGHVKVTVGQPTEAMASYDKALAICRKLVKDHPTVAEYKDELAGCLSSMSDIHAQTGNTKEAISLVRQALAVNQELATAQPDVIEYQHDLATTCHKLGLLFRVSGDLKDAAVTLRLAVTISQRLADKNPAVIEYQMDLANHHNSVGLIEIDLGNLKEALAAYQQSRAIHERLLKPDPSNHHFLGGLARNFNNIGRLHAKLGQFDEAFAALDQGLAIRQKLADAEPKTAGLAVSLGYSHAYRGWAGVRAGRTAEAAKDLRKTLELWRKAPLLTVEHRFEIVRALALLAGLGADAKSGVTAADAKNYAGQAVAAFGDAIKAGWAKPNELKEPDFDPVRGRDDFKKLLAGLEKK